MNTRYLVKGKIGDGGLGEVYLATDTQLDRDVALKRVKPPEKGDVETLHADLIREARTLSSLQHPHIVTIYDVGQDEMGPFVVMELLKGETLDDVIARGAMTLADFKEVVIQSLEGMIAAQEMGLVHRDLKPSNVMVIWLPSGKFQIKILDFGLAKFSLTATRQTVDQESSIMGSIFFMAPEQFERLPLDARTDMYSLGCIFYQVLTTQYPFGGTTGPEVMVSHLQHQVWNLHETRPDLPIWLADWVMWLISRDMEDRPFNAKLALDYYRSERNGLKTPTPNVPVTSTGVKILGRGTGPGSAANVAAKTTRQVSHKVTERIGVSAATGHSQHQAGSATTGTPASSRSSRTLAPQKASSPRGLWMAGAAAALIGGGTFWAFAGSAAPPLAVSVPFSPVEAILNASTLTPNSDTMRVLMTALRGEGPEATRALVAIGKLAEKGATEAIITELLRASGPLQTKLIEVVCKYPGTASDAASRLALIKIAATATGATRAAALDGIGAIGGGGEAPAVIGLMNEIKDKAEREHLFSVVDQLFLKEPNEIARYILAAKGVVQTTTENLAATLNLFSRRGGGLANRAACAEIASGGERQQAALTSFRRWPAPDPELLKIMRTALAETTSATEKENLVTAICQLVPQCPFLSGSEQISALRDLLPSIHSPRSREAFFNAIADTTATPEGLAYAKEFLKDPTFSGLAAKAVTQLTTSLLKVTPVSDLETRLAPAKALILGPTDDTRYAASSRAITQWKNPATRLAWDVKVTQPGAYRVEISYSGHGKSERGLRVCFGQTGLLVPMGSTDANDRFASLEAGEFTLLEEGVWRLWLEMQASEMDPGVANIQEVILTQTGKPISTSIPVVAKEAATPLVVVEESIPIPQSMPIAADLARSGTSRNKALATLNTLPSIPSPLANAVLAATSEGPPAEQGALADSYCTFAPKVLGLNGARFTDSMKRIQPKMKTPAQQSAFCRSLKETAAPEALALANQLATQPTWGTAAEDAAKQIQSNQLKVTTLKLGDNKLPASQAVIQNSAPPYTVNYSAQKGCLLNWKFPGGRVSWDITVDRPSTASISVVQSQEDNNGAAFRITLGEGMTETNVQSSGKWGVFIPVSAGQFKIPSAGTWRLNLEPSTLFTGQCLFDVSELIVTLK